jgi:hypothetical protein
MTDTERDLLARLVDSAWPLVGAARVWLSEPGGESTVLVRVPAAQWAALIDAIVHGAAWRASPAGADHIYVTEGAADETVPDAALSDLPYPLEPAARSPIRW